MNKKISYLLIFQIFATVLLSCGGTMITVNGLQWDRNISTMNWQDAVDFCSKKKARLPTLDELSAAYKSGNDVLLSKRDPFWTSNAYIGDTAFAMVVHFSSGDVYHYKKSYDYYVRCVR